MLPGSIIACYSTPAVVAQLIVKIGVIFVVVLSFIIFHEERRVIRDPEYIIGTVLSFIGVGVVLTGGAASFDLALTGTSMLLIFTAFLWAVYAVSMKHLVSNIHPVPLFTVLAAYLMIGAAVTVVVLGDITNIVPTDGRRAAIAFISGFIPIAIAHPVYYFAQKYLGAAWRSSWTLLNPFITFLLSLVLLPNETLSPVQLLGGGILVAGTLSPSFQTSQNLLQSPGRNLICINHCSGFVHRISPSLDILLPTQKFIAARRQ